MNPKAEQIRLRYLYRKIVLSGDVKLSHAAARRLVGPDCAYQLYGKVQRKKSNKRKS
jgi:hypothetical protein